MAEGGVGIKFTSEIESVSFYNLCSAEIRCLMKTNRGCPSFDEIETSS